MDFNKLCPNDVLRADTQELYNAEMGFFASTQFVPLNTNIYFVEKIAEFPLWPFLIPEHTLFFRFAATNALDASVLIVTKLATDTGAEFRTLLKFKNIVIAEFIKPEYRSSFAAKLKEVKFDDTLKDLFEQARVLRNEIIAHNIVEEARQAPPVAPLEFSELKKMRDALVALFRALCFNVDYLLEPPSYSPYVQYPDPNYRSDIEEVLGYVAAHSSLVEALRSDPYEKVVLRQQFDAELIHRTNRYLLALGLPQI